MSRTGAEMKASENQSKAMHDHLTAVENHLGLLCSTLASYTRKTAHLRDKGDLLSQEIADYAEYEKWNPTMRQALTQFAESLSAVQDYREAQVHRLEKKVVSHLSSYGPLCKQTKNNLKGAFGAQNRELAQKKKLEQMRIRSPENAQMIATGELQKASLEASRSQLSLEHEMDRFEARKIVDVKHVLREFVNVELGFHAKALELYTRCFKSLDLISVEKDMQVFKSQIHPDNYATRQALARAALPSNGPESDSINVTPTPTAAHISGFIGRPLAKQRQAVPSPRTKEAHSSEPDIEVDDSIEYEEDEDCEDGSDEDDCSEPQATGQPAAALRNVKIQ